MHCPLSVSTSPEAQDYFRLIMVHSILKYEWQASTPDLYRGKKINLESNDTILVPVEILARI